MNRLLGRMGAAWSDRYEKMGCLAGLLYLIGLPVGLFVCLWCLELVGVVMTAGVRA